ncbi:MAG: nitrogenase cofactor biosynthesis protein NifB [Sporomusaceae bacterium]|nr:nitrogenase cofactor biosynthesis protein NifB [Sporomusaceae bacterium]
MSCLCPNAVSADVLAQTSKHPCYSAEAHHQYARMHLPVAPRCNIQCNYCNRKYDCVNESRPGVTSEVLTPELAKAKYEWVKSEIAALTVVGIAGPGDALADWPATRQTIEQIKAINDGAIFCLSTNGLLLPDYAAEIVALGIRHVTVTVNALDPAVGAKIYRHVFYQGQYFQGQAAAKLLLARQLAGIEYLAGRGVLVKVNIVMIKGINDAHIPEVVKKVKALGAFITNIMPLIPAAGSAFEHFPQTSMKEVNALRNRCQLDLQQMRHCRQCRADAIGLLGEDRSHEFRMCARQAAAAPPLPPEKVYTIAVTSRHGTCVDQHFGHAEEFSIYRGNGRDFTLLERRPVAKFCGGMAECGTEDDRRDATIRAVGDCQAVLTMRIGQHAKEKLAEQGIQSIEYCDAVETGLRHAVSSLREAAAAALKGVKAG